LPHTCAWRQRCSWWRRAYHVWVRGCNTGRLYHAAACHGVLADLALVCVLPAGHTIRIFSAAYPLIPATLLHCTILPLPVCLLCTTMATARLASLDGIPVEGQRAVKP
jgi:hypothetical protein